jgi:peptidoglycan/LPS O-acetylase OafA/YrhL
MHYRSDVDGLRAVAIIPVVLYHFGFPTFSGGYVGVDVFFVISGFLITSIIYREMLEGHFSFTQFYEHRIRRLFPALFFIIAVTAIVAAFLLLPGDFRSFSQSVVAATVFGANLLFWKTSGYFDGPAEMKPLLHTWSLSVEEQFYIVFPVVLLVVIRYARQHVRLVLILATLISFFASLVAVEKQQEAAFYLPVFRAWELLLGALLALNAVPHPATHMQRHALSLLGLGLILYSVFSFSAETAFPGVYALFPSLGTALIIYAGSGERAGGVGCPSLVGAVLGWRPLVLIGLISYSLYLWHWPLIVFAKYYALRELTMGEKMVLLMASILLATLSWRYIERPFRGRSGWLSRKQLFVFSTMLMAIAITAGLAGHLTNGFQQRVPQEIAKIESVGSQTDPWRKNCQNLPVEKISLGDVCAVGEKKAYQPDFLLWGDSHALALAPAFNEISKQKQRSGWFIGKNACPPLLGVERFDSHHGCIPYNEAVAQFIEQHQGIRTVYLAGRWGLHANGPRYGRETGQPSVISPQGVEDNPDAFQQGLERTLAFLKQRNIDVAFIMAVPEVGWLVPSELARAKWFAHPAPAGPTLEAYSARQQPVKEILAKVKASHDFRVLEVAPIFCPEGQCFVEHGGVPLYRDDDHLSKQGAQFATQLIVDLL